jgi:hypothetical protein
MRDVVYAIAFDAGGRAILGAGGGQHLPHRIAHDVYVAAGAAGDPGDGVSRPAGTDV